LAVLTLGRARRDIHTRLCTAIPELVGDSVGVGTRGDQQRRVGVTQVVQAHGRQPGGAVGRGACCERRASREREVSGGASEGAANSRSRAAVTRAKAASI
jgi:hypothetical protein